MKSKKIIAAIVLVFSGILFGAVLVSGFGWVSNSFADIKLGASEPPVKLNADANSFSQAFIEVADKVTPSIVQINVVASIENDPQQDFFFFPFKDFNIPKEQAGSGSGIIISEEGYILTNNHVVENAKTITVKLHDKRELDAKLIGKDPLTDLAVIKIDAKDLPVAYLGDSDKLKVGQWVMAIGNPLSLASTVTAGIVSALNRTNLGLKRDSYGVENFIQTDAAINPGNSGGALVDLSGAVVGVNSAIATQTGGYMGYGFAIPINVAKNVAKDLIAHGRVSRGYIGVQIGEVTDAIAKSLDLGKSRGVIVQKIVEGGAASKEDIKEGDIILTIDGREVFQPSELQSYIATKTAGTKVTLKIWRDGKELERTVTLKPRDEDVVENVKDSKKSESDTDSENVNSITFDDLGISVKNLTSKEKTDYDISNGVLITNVKPYSKAFYDGLAKDLVILKADKKPVNNVSELRKIIKEKKGSAVLLVVADKQGNTRFVGLNIPN